MLYLNDNKLCLTYDEFVGIFGVETYKSDKKRENITVHGLGGNGRKVFIEYETMQPKRKEEIKKRYGNPYEYLAKQPVLDLIDWDYQAHKFYQDYVLPNNLKLPATNVDAKGKPQINYVERYTKAANWLNMIGRITTDKKALKNNLKLTIGEFWDTVSELILKENIAIPASYKQLTAKLRAYNQLPTAEERYELLIEKHRFGNDNAKKIDTDEAEALLLKMLSDPRKHDDTVIAAAYNQYAKAKDKETITPAAVGNFRRKNEHVLAATRDGKKKAYNKYTKEMQRDRASAPLLFINADDNCLDLFFEVETWTEAGGTKKSKYYRPMVYVITDTYNDYILGYAVGDKVTHELVYQAFRNALNHIQMLTGSYYLPHQLQTDRWGLDVKMKNALGEFYKRVASFTPQAHGVPQGKYIERSFGTEWHQVLKAMPTNNYAGQNITAKERLSAEYIVDAAKNYPKIDRVPEVVETFINIMRMKANPKTGISRQKEWIEAFNASEKSKAKQINAGMKLQIMGKKHLNPKNPDNSLLTITSAGLRPTINGKQVSIDLPDEVIFQHNGKKVEVFYDPEKLTEFLITDSKGLRFVAQKYNNVPGALADYLPGDGKRIQGLFDAKKQVANLLTETLNTRLLALEGTNIDPQALIQAGVLLKDVKQGAEMGYLESMYQPKVASIEIAPQTGSLINTTDEAEDIDHYDLY
nr:hypothetical protein [Mucilaginibacter sp. L294]